MKFDVEISVVVPIYKVEKYVGNTMKSLVNQTYSNFEVVLVDDGSPDHSSEIAAKILKDNEIQYKLIKQQNAGQGRARNTGFNAAQGKWIMFLDSDDTIQSFALQHLSDLSKRYSEVDAVFSDFQLVKEEEIFNYSDVVNDVEVLSYNILTRSFLVRDRNFLVPGTLYKAEFLKTNCILHKGLRWSEDQYFQWEVLANMNKAVYSKNKLYNYLIRPGSIMRATSIDLMIEAYKEFLLLPDRITNSLVKKYMLPRWVLGCMHMVAMRKDYASYIKLSDAMSFRKHLKLLCSFPDIKIRILAIIGCINKKGLYIVLSQSLR